MSSDVKVSEKSEDNQLNPETSDTKQDPSIEDKLKDLRTNY